LTRSSWAGLTQTIIHLQRLSSNGVAFHSYTEPHLATDDELVRNILLALLSSLAKVEAQKISERRPVVTGLHNKRAANIPDGPRRRERRGLRMVEYNLDGRGSGAAHTSPTTTSHVAPFQQPDILSCRAFSLQSADHFNTCERCQIIAVSVESVDLLVADREGGSIN
jgi:hypothetical protein